MRVIRIEGLINSQPTKHDGRLLSAYNPDANGYMGRIESTDDPSQAMVFPSSLAALECWRSVSTTLPVRPDGKPNRPLTAFSVSVEEIGGPQAPRIIVHVPD